MFSEEEKARALEALDECDRCITWAIRKFGTLPGRRCATGSRSVMQASRRANAANGRSTPRAREPTRWPIKELPSIPATGLNSKSLEFFFHRDWRGVSMEEFMSRLNDYPVFYNERRVKETLGWLSPSACRRSPGLAA